MAATTARRDAARPGTFVASRASSLLQDFTECRLRTAGLTDGLSDADATVQSMDDASPAKWHLAHTTWYFEAFVLSDPLADYEPYDPRFNYLFNSYYETVGAHHPRPQRGLLTRPSLTAVLRYRGHAERAIEKLMLALDRRDGARASALCALVELGIQHEQQHQELLLTDLLHLFSRNPLAPVYRPAPEPAIADATSGEPARFVGFDGGRCTIGHSGSAFAYDCEGPQHDVLLQPFALADRPVNNAEWLRFIEAGGYRTPLLWLSDGWDRVCAEGWEAPLHWRHDDNDGWHRMTLHGMRTLDLQAPVSHISYYEADAFARFAGRRLPTEFEWEEAARRTLAHSAGSSPEEQDAPVFEGHFAEDMRYVPLAPCEPYDGRLRQLFGDVWEWTSSAFAPYPHFRAAEGAVGEYNGKFMCGQYVLRGGSCATPRGHVRSTYRNFFPPHARWQFSGVRLAEDRP